MRPRPSVLRRLHVTLGITPSKTPQYPAKSLGRLLPENWPHADFWVPPVSSRKTASSSASISPMLAHRRSGSPRSSASVLWLASRTFCRPAAHIPAT